MAELSKAIAQLMAERDPQHARIAPLTDPKLRELRRIMRNRVPPGERGLADALLVHLFDKAGAEVLAMGEVAQLSAAVLAIFRLVMEPTLDEPRVVVSEPDVIHEGWDTPGTVVDTCMRDRPFIVDTVRECLLQAGCVIRQMLHPIFAIERDAAGVVSAVAPPGGGRQESVVYVEIDRVQDPAALATLLTRRLTDLIHATDDYLAMRARAQETAELLRARQWLPPWDSDSEEIPAFLDWLCQKSFVFLGYREYQLAGDGAERTAEVRRGSGLGILRDEGHSTYATARPLAEALQRRLNEPPLLIVSKTNAESPIHRRAHMDYLGIKEVDPAGVVVGERRFLGLFTSKAYADEPTAVPLLRRRLAAVLEAEGAVEESYDYKAIVATFNSIPKVELLATPVYELHAEIKMILDAASGSRSRDVRLLQRLDALGRGVFVVVLVPRERFSDELYRGAETRLAAALDAPAVLEQRLVIDDESDQVRMHFYFAASPAGVAVPTEELRACVTNLLRTWDDRLRDALRESALRDQARQLTQRYLPAFSDQYKAATDVAAAVRDIEHMETLAATRTLQVDLMNAGSDARFTALKLYLVEEELVLSDFLPVLENLGLRVFAEEPLAIEMPGVGRVRIHTFLVQAQAGPRLDTDSAAPLLIPALVMLHAGGVENDRLNTLIIGAQLEWRQVDLLRTYVNHGAQIGTAASRAAIVHALVSYPRSARLLWEYFAEKFDGLKPATQRERLARSLPGIEQRFIASLEAVQSIADDRILRALFSTLAATVRTNYYAPPADDVRRTDGPDSAGDPPAPVPVGGTALAVKLDCARIPHLPRPHPLFEIYVHAPHVDGLHLRGGRVARGGIRLSDRPDDFRTEIHDLMRTQTVKNAVIIPAGAKGGFIVKHRAGATATLAQVVAAYRTFITALLDLTDNVVHGRIVQPAGMLVYDDADPYLVVAADKGTATFSDIANELAAQHQFWLGDAFASGGRHGYDHKKEGITARGAWECVRRHFREMGRDADTAVMTVIGIGDMSGDVFGNGLLLSRGFLLRAAFNHRHIFLDPNPDPIRAFAERARLFQLPRSSWSDYSASAISPGGGVYPRNAKKVPLSEAARAMLGLTEAGLTEASRGEAPSSEEVVHAILCMEADLLWNGGIGTYVKASDETHTDVGDSANDTVRVNGADVRVKVIAEGGNLGCTQRGRIEYALHGGRINTDAIDNSAGVDMSDHEVNLKIALAPALEGGQVSFDERNQLLTEVTPDITRRVLDHNRSQARALSLDQLRSQRRLADFRDLMAQLEADGWLDRRFEDLPDRDGLRNRRSQFLGLTRPELAVLLAHSKLALQRQLLASTLPDDPYYEPYLCCSLPDVIDERFGQGVRSHRLRREIISVEIANALIDTMGAAFVARVSRDTGAAATTVVRAWTVAMAVSGAGEVWDVIRDTVPRDTVPGDTTPPLSPAAEARCWFALEAAVGRATKWIIATQPHDEPAGLSDMLAASTRELVQVLPQALPASAHTQPDVTIEALVAEGTPRPLAQRLAALDQLADLFEIGHVARELDVSRSAAAEVYYRVGEVFDLEWVHRSLGELPAEDRWERRALEGLSEGLMYARRELTRNVLQYRSAGGSVDAHLQEYSAAHQEQLTALAALVRDIKSARRPSLAALLVVMHELNRLVDAHA